VHSLHRNAPLTVEGRRRLVRQIERGRAIAHVAAEMQVSRATATKWWQRYLAEGDTGLHDRSSRPHRSPTRTAARIEKRVVRLRRGRKLGPARIGPIVGLAPSTVQQVLRRHGMSRLAWLDRPTGTVIRRIVTTRPGELVHVDVKKLGRIPDGGGWRSRGRAAVRSGRDQRSRGMSYVHSAIDAHSRLAFSEIHDDEKGPTCAEFWTRAVAFFAAHGIAVDAVLTDNAKNYLGVDFTAALDGIEHRRIRPYTPRTNGKIERFNRTLLEEWAYVRPYVSDAARTRALARWLHSYNHHRCHTALGGEPPISRVNNVSGQYSWGRPVTWCKSARGSTT
jgi:transposase InsO family protein